MSVATVRRSKPRGRNTLRKSVSKGAAKRWLGEAGVDVHSDGVNGPPPRGILWLAMRGTLAMNVFI